MTPKHRTSPLIGSTSATNVDYAHLAELAAQAQGQIFLIGVRPGGKGWFAHCDGVEWDGDGPDMAVRSVVSSLAEKARSAARASNVEAKALAQRADDLADTEALIQGTTHE